MKSKCAAWNALVAMSTHTTGLLCVIQVITLINVRNMNWMKKQIFQQTRASFRISYETARQKNTAE